MRFKNGLFIGWKWTFGNSGTSTDSAVIASYHRPDSITWRWALYWQRWKFHSWKLFQLWRSTNGNGYGWFSIPFVGTFSLSAQPHMFRTTAERVDVSEGKING